MGSDITGLATDLYMIWWDGKFEKALNQAQIKLDVYGRFKDDLDFLTEIIPVGINYKDGNLVNNSGKNQLITDEENTIRIINKIANEVDDMITLTYDIPEKHEDQKLPVLDLKVWVDKTQELLFEFYEKPTKNERVILPSSALNWQAKRTILTQEAIRRLKNTSPSLGEETQNLHLSKFMHKLKISGYSEHFRSEIILSAKSAYKIMVENDLKGIKPLYRNSEQIENDRSQQKKNRTQWWNKKGNNFSAVLFVPPTPNAELAKLIQARERELNKNSKLSIKVIEKGGTKVKQLLVRKSPFESKKCENLKCPICQNTDKSVTNDLDRIPCGTENVGYRFICTKCGANYEGETARMNNIRAIEHIKDLEKKKKCSPLFRHEAKYHPNGTKFQFKTTKKFFDALSRQADEAVRINHSNSAKIINNRSEFNSAPIGQLKVIKSGLRKSVHFVTDQSNPQAQAIQVSSTDEASIGGEN